MNRPDIFIILQVQLVHKNFVKPRIHPHGNIDNNFCKNADNIFQIENSGNFKSDFFLNLYLQTFFVIKKLLLLWAAFMIFTLIFWPR